MSFPQKSLDTTDPDQILYQHDVIEIAIPGGVRTDILDRMRVTLKVKHLSIRHNLDLYNSHQLDKLVRLVAERLEIGTSVISAALMDLIDLLESQEKETEDKRKILSEAEIKAAKLFTKTATAQLSNWSRVELLEHQQFYHSTDGQSEQDQSQCEERQTDQGFYDHQMFQSAQSKESAIPGQSPLHQQ